MHETDMLRSNFGGPALFGYEKDASFKKLRGSELSDLRWRGALTQRGRKSGMLPYLVTKNHSFSDGNKRIAGTLCLWFMDNNASSTVKTAPNELHMPAAVAALMNKITFSTTKVTGATNLVGPFVTANYPTKLKTTHILEYEGDVPTLKELVKLKSAILGTNIIPDGLCYVMNESMKGQLEATPKWDGSNVAIVDDAGKINGVPVFTTNNVADGIVHIGAFKYAPQGLFGDMVFIVDPYSQARKNAIDFVLNTDYAITVLRQEAFATMSKKAVVGG